MISFDAELIAFLRSEVDRIGNKEIELGKGVSSSIVRIIELSKELDIANEKLRIRKANVVTTIYRVEDIYNIFKRALVDSESIVDRVHAIKENFEKNG